MKATPKIAQIAAIVRQINRYDLLADWHSMAFRPSIVDWKKRKFAEKIKLTVMLTLLVTAINKLSKAIRFLFLEIV